MDAAGDVGAGLPDRIRLIHEHLFDGHVRG
jgi:hypothetical protein